VCVCTHFTHTHAHTHAADRIKMSTSSGAVAVGAGSGTAGSDPEYLKVLLTRGDVVTKRGEKGHQGYEVSFVIVLLRGCVRDCRDREVV
jgi:hypothetical protein